MTHRIVFLNDCGASFCLLRKTAVTYKIHSRPKSSLDKPAGNSTFITNFRTHKQLQRGQSPGFVQYFCLESSLSVKHLVTGLQTNELIKKGNHLSLCCLRLSDSYLKLSMLFLPKWIFLSSSTKILVLFFYKIVTWSWTGVSSI